MVFYILMSLLVAFAMAALFLWNLRQVVRAVLRTVAFNVAGGNAMARLVPNIAYLGLFLLLLHATWF